MSPDEPYTRVCPETQPRTDVVQLGRDDTHPPPTPANKRPQRLGVIPQWWGENARQALAPSGLKLVRSEMARRKQMFSKAAGCLEFYLSASA